MSKIIVRYYVNVPAGETVHLRSEAEKNSSNVITELPRGYCVELDYTLTPWKHVKVDDSMDTIYGYVHDDYLTNDRPTDVDSRIWIPRYSTPTWKKSSHSGKYYLPVKRIQTDLYNIGYTEVGTADGYYGANTDKAVRAFQSDHGLAVDGCFGKNSKAKLWDLIDRKG